MTKRAKLKPCFAAVILAAGMGTRMKSSRSKVLHELAGLSLVGHVVRAVAQAGAAKTLVVVSKEGDAVVEEVRRHCADAQAAIQDPPLGTGHAVQAALAELGDFDGDVVVLFGDTPLIRPENISELMRGRAKGAAVVVTGFYPDDALAYGRLITDKKPNMDDGIYPLRAIVEFKDANESERAIGFCNGGMMAIAGEHVRTLVEAVKDDNAKNEFYLTDVVEIAVENGLSCSAVETPPDDVMGINARTELAAAEAIFQIRKRQQMMEEGVTLSDPDTVHFSYDTELGQDVTVGQHVVFGPGVKVSNNVTIKPFTHLEGATLATGAQVGPYARLRPGANIGEGAKIGNFVEIKNTDLGAGAKVSHLTYLGDANVGANANIGAGTITCNYDGFNKNITDIGEEAFIGSNTALVAPVTIGKGANIGAGSTIGKDVPDDAMGVTRADQRNIEGWAPRYRKKKQREKEENKKKK